MEDIYIVWQDILIICKWSFIQIIAEMFESLGHPDRIKALAEHSSSLDSFLVFIPIIDNFFLL